MDKPKKAIAYYRVSSEEQRKHQNIGMQKTRLAQFPKDKYEIIREFQDDGASGKTIEKRPGFQSCLDFIATGKADFLLVYMVDRIGRFADRDDRNKVIALLRFGKTSVDGPYDELFRYDNDDDMDALKGQLNESRRDNVRRGKRIHEGHEEKRLNGGWSGGKLPYGIRHIKRTGYYHEETGLFIADRQLPGTVFKERGFYPVDKEVATLEEIFNKTKDGTGAIALAKYMNANLDKFPKRKRRRKNNQDAKWDPILLGQIIRKDFYFTGIIEPKLESLLPVDTGIKLFPRELVEQARRERSARRWRNGVGPRQVE
jgi:DNA invertase Pin-like site-specific DNA recombinase